MQIGVPKETKDQEFRVGLTPASVRVLTENNHSVFVETMAGCHAGFTDEDYLAAGGKIVASAESAWHQDLVVKVKEPLKSEYQFLRKDLLLFTYLHLAANRELTEHLVDSGTCAIAYETVEQVGANRLPLLTPMSIIAGRLAVQFGARFLESQQGGEECFWGVFPELNPVKW